jgi:hypothetical protein
LRSYFGLTVILYHASLTLRSLRSSLEESIEISLKRHGCDLVNRTEMAQKKIRQMDLLSFYLSFIYLFYYLFILFVF